MSLFPTTGSQLYIDGELRTTATTFAVLNPATEAIIGQAADGTPADMDVAIAAARNAFDHTDWATNHEFRAKCLRQLKAGMEKYREELRELTIAEVGAPRFLTYGPQLEGPVADLEYWANLAETYSWTNDLGTASPMGIASTRVIHKEAIGVVGAITPWNFPHQINLAKIGSALAAGATVVLKPAPDTPFAAAAIGAIAAAETEIPAGVLNIVTSSNHQLGEQLSTDNRVDLISFTGSTATGKKVMRAAAESLKKVFLELGGKSAFIVLDDADFSTALAMAAFSVSTHAGQGCAITTRLLVPQSRYDEAVQITRDALAGIAVGDPNQPGTVCGPLISAKQFAQVSGYLDSAIAEGGVIEVGGARPDALSAGYFMAPTLISGLKNSARAAQEEIFGPVLVILGYTDDDDAITIANDSLYGLSGAIWGSNEARITKVANKIRTGTLSVNGGIWYSPDVPFGGYKASGIGREMGVAGFEEYLETKVIARRA